jgi:hypothetical protein
MLQFSPINFGLLIAYFLPGFITVFALKYLSEEVSQLIQAAQANPINIGALIFLGTASLIAGLIVSAFRSVVLDELHYNAGIQRPQTDYSKLTGDKLKLFQEMVENVYRYYQFYGNLFSSLTALLILKYFIAGSPICDSRLHFSSFIFLALASIVLLVASRKTLSNVCKGIEDICKQEEAIK